VAPEILEALRQDLSAVRPVRRAKPVAGRADLVGVKGKANSHPRALAAGLALFRGFDGLPWSPFHGASSGEMGLKTPYAEIMPAVGTGQHLALPGVRYCHYQEERLRIIQQEAHSPEDVRAFNLLAVDYNARWSDFFYQEKDLKQVVAEVAARRHQLEADARKIVASW